jgi:hypothetical protein
MARRGRKRGYASRARSYIRRRGGHKKKGIIFGLGVGDIAMISYTLGQMGVQEGATQAMNGDFAGGGATIASTTMNNIFPIITGDIILGVGFKLVRKFLPSSAKRYF